MRRELTYLACRAVAPRLSLHHTRVDLSARNIFHIPNQNLKLELQQYSRCHRQRSRQQSSYWNSPAAAASDSARCIEPPWCYRSMYTSPVFDCETHGIPMEQTLSALALLTSPPGESLNVSSVRMEPDSDIRWWKRPKTSIYNNTYEKKSV